MRLGLLYGFSHSHDSLNLMLEAERLGYDSVWTGEAWGSDTIVPLAWIGALTKKILTDSDRQRGPVQRDRSLGTIS